LYGSTYKKFNKNTIDSFVSKLVVFVIKLSSYLEKYFRYKTINSQTYTFAASWNQNLQQARGAL
jgi:hypothetical protein